MCRYNKDLWAYLMAIVQLDHLPEVPINTSWQTGINQVPCFCTITERYKLDRVQVLYDTEKANLQEIGSAIIRGRP